MIDDVVITGMGAVSALGVGVDALASAFEVPPRDGIVTIGHFDTRAYTTHLGGVVPGPRGKEPAIDFARVAAAEAKRSAGVEAISPERIALVLGSSLGTRHARMYELAAELARVIGVRGPCVTISTACSSSSTAVGLARDLVGTGVVDAAIAGGTDELGETLFAGFHALGALSTEPCAPFSAPVGTTLGEGAAFLVLERAQGAAARGAAPIAWLLGYGLSADAYHPTTPDPGGGGIARAIRAALADARVEPAAIDWVNAHATGTDTNDPAEARGIAAALGRLDLPVSASKSFLGHAQGAAGALELVVTVLALRAQRLPPTLHVTELRHSAPRDVVPAPREHPQEVALSINAAFGGANSAVVVGRQAPRTARVAERRRPRVASAAVLVGAVDSLEALGAAIDGAQRLGARVAPVPVERLLPMADTRGMDPSTRFMATVAARALGGPARGERRDRTGIVAAVSGYSAASAAALERSIDERGLPRLNATAFSKMVLNAATGVTATWLSLRGASTTLTAGRGGGAVAIAYAAELLAKAGDTDAIVACAVDETRSETHGEARGESRVEAAGAEGAGALLLGREGPVELRAWHLGPPGDVTQVVAAVLAEGGLARADATFTDDPEPGDGACSLAAILGPIASAGSTIACAHAFETLRAGRARSALVTSRGGGASVALLFVRGDTA